jgi:hypothetical protein
LNKDFPRIMEEKNLKKEGEEIDIDDTALYMKTTATTVITLIKKGKLKKMRFQL